PGTPETGAQQAIKDGLTEEQFVKGQKLVYHGSPKPLKKFEKRGAFFTEEYADATGFAGTPDNVYEGYLNLKKPLVVDSKGKKWDEIVSPYGKSTQEIISNAEKTKDFDGVVFKNVIDNVVDDVEGGIPGTIHYPFDANKSFINESQLRAEYQAAKGAAAKPGMVKLPGKLEVRGIKPTKPVDNYRIYEPSIGDKLLRVFTGGGAELNKKSAAGRELRELIMGTRKQADLLKGSYEVELQDALKGLSKNERITAGKMVEGLSTSTNPKITAAAAKLDFLYNKIGDVAETGGVKIQIADGKEIPFKKRDNYIPRVYNFDKLAKGKMREGALRHLVETGQAKDVAEADKILEGFISRNASRKAGNLEHARTVDLPGYEADPLKAGAKYVESAAKRLTELSNYGQKDQIAKNLIERVRQEGGDSRYAQEVFDLMTGQKRYENKAVDMVTKFNYITKLDLGFITNATQPVNTATKYGVLPTLEGIIKAYATPKKAGRVARLSGAIDDPITMGKAEGLSMGRIMETVLKPFSFVEKKNRVIASIAGQRVAAKNAAKLLSSPTNKAAMRRLRDLGIEPEKLVAQGGLREDDILGAGYEASRTTQFKVDAIDIPPGWKTNIGRFLGQFKSFSFKQSEFVRDAVLTEAFKHGNFTPMLRLVALGVPVSFLAQSVRNKLTGREESSETAGLDVRKWDKYLKVAGTIPTDLVIQGKFLYDTYNNQYASPLKKTGRTLSTFTGPSVGEAFSIADALESAGSTSEKNRLYNREDDAFLSAKRLAAGYVPGVGEYIKNKAFPFPKRYTEGTESAAKEIAQQIKELNKGKSVKDSPIAQTNDGKYMYRIGNKREYADTFEAAELGMAKDRFKKSGKISGVYKDNVLRLNKDGTVKSTPKLEYDYSLNTNNLQKAKTNKDFKGWMQIANKQLGILEKQLSEPTLDELEQSDLLKKADRLIADMQKYAGYGGFKKGKKGKKPKSISIAGGGSTRPKLNVSVARYNAPQPKVSGIRTKVSSPVTPARTRKSGGSGLQAIGARKLRIKR
ncbi:MAG: hypothetical protein H0U60_19935, partial [Blastocatellia bacterium]|nr:hypothetical protein [Blastocatellia bacterium]